MMYYLFHFQNGNDVEVCRACGFEETMEFLQKHIAENGPILSIETSNEHFSNIKTESKRE